MVKRALSTEDEGLLSQYPRDFKTIPTFTSYGRNEGDVALNKADEAARMDFLEAQLVKTMKAVVETKERPIFTIALIAGDVVMLDALARSGLLEKVTVIYVDTYTLFPETNAYLREVEEIYGFKAKVYHAAGIADQKEFEAKLAKGELQYKDSDGVTQDWKLGHFDYSNAAHVKVYDSICKVEPLQRALKDANTDCWINGRRRDHGAERASISTWEGSGTKGAKVNPLAFWSFEDCWLYLRRHNVKYHPLHDKGYSSIGDVQSTLQVPHDEWMKYAGERKGRFQNMKNADGSAKTECGIHSSNRPTKKARTSVTSPPEGEAVKA
jgi:phosphoadenosine phosphosulfate reductase